MSMCRKREIYVYYIEAMWGGVTIGGVISRDNFTATENSPASEWDGKYPNVDWEGALAEQLPW